MAAKLALLVFLSLCVLLIALPLYPAAAPDPDAIIGTWVVAEKDAHIEIYRQGDVYFGRISWLRGQDGGKPSGAGPAPEAMMHETPRVGLIIVRNFRFDGKAWKAGTLYDPTDGKSYRGIITLPGKDELHVRGYLGISLFGRTTVWHRVP
jgi:uncharacterized protein (DUF2147 family)